MSHPGLLQLFQRDSSRSEPVAEFEMKLLQGKIKLIPFSTLVCAGSLTGLSLKGKGIGIKDFIHKWRIKDDFCCADVGILSYSFRNVYNVV